MKKILMVEDNKNIREINRITLQKHGYTVLEAETLDEGRNLLSREQPDLVILDVMLPDGSGLDFCTELRAKYGIPILFLSALGDTDDVLSGFEKGGDDYLPKPYDPGVLAARVEALLRRSGYARTITRGAMTVDLVKRTVEVNGEDVRLTQIQFSLLLLFIQNENRVLQTGMLYEEVWGQPLVGDTAAIKTVISRLREKIRPAGFSIDAIRGRGYMLVEEK